MADGLLGLLGNVGHKVQGLLNNPAVQGIGAAAAFGFNPLLGLLAAPGIKNTRDRRSAENELLRQEIRARNRQEKAQGDLVGLLGSQAQAAVPSPIGLLNPNGGMDVIGATRRESVPTVATPQGQQQLLGLLAQLAPAQAISTLLAQPEPSSLDRKLSTVEGRLGRPLTDEEVLKLSGGGTTINVGGESKLDEPIPLTQLGKVRLPNGQVAPIGTTFRQAQGLGAKVVPEAEHDRSVQADTALGILNELEALAIGPDGIFQEVQPGLANRAGAALDFALDSLTQDDPKASRFQDLSQSTIAPFVRFLGESGALAEGDVSRALGLLPNIFPLPDTGEVAREKLKTLRGIIERGVRKLNSPVVTLDDGTKVEFLPNG